MVIFCTFTYFVCRVSAGSFVASTSARFSAEVLGVLGEAGFNNRPKLSFGDGG